MPVGTVPTNNITSKKGSDLTIPFVVGSDLIADITGWTIVFTYKNTDDSPALTISINATVTDGPNRLFQVVVPAATHETILTTYTGKYDVWRTNAGFHWCLSVGTFTAETERRVQTP